MMAVTTGLATGWNSDSAFNREAGLVRLRTRGTRHYYEIDPRGLDMLRSYLEGFWGEALSAFKTVAERKAGGQHDEFRSRD